MSNSIEISPFSAPLPEGVKEYPKGLYEKFPAFEIEKGKISAGYDNLANTISGKIDSGLRVLVIDGYHGVNWELFTEQLKARLQDDTGKINWINFNECQKEEEKILKEIAPFLGGDDRIFGSHYPFGPEVFFDTEKVAKVRIEASVKRSDKAGELTIIYGDCSSIVELWDELWYLDISKDKIQEKFREGKLKNIANHTANFEEFYKRSYFVEWPAFNRLKKRLLPEINLFVDMINEETPSYMEGNEFREALNNLSENPFRVRPWFFPGPWGGQYMKGHMDLDKDNPNIAWSFELIVPENGLLFESGDNRLECSFDCAMFANNENILGKNAAKQFKYEWPIRFDYLDTIDGGNLSTQVHPRPDYIKKEFGETYTQDETYYIVNAKKDAKVYLGLTEECDLDEFKRTLEKSVEEEKEIDIEKFVNHETAKPHDLFLIPNGTVHCSGSGNMVLEISATPYIFTFKIYDYLRRDLEGKLRPINIERGFKNIRPERRGDWVKDNLVAKPKLLEQGSDWKLFELYNAPYTFYNIERVEFDSEYEFDLDDKAYTVNLVEGEKVEVISESGRSTNLSYIETMLIPAAAKKIKLINKGNTPCKMVLVYVRKEIGNKEPVNNPLS